MISSNQADIEISSERVLRRLALGTTGFLALVLASQPGAAQEAETVQVTGTRIMQDGYSAPTPVTVIGQVQIENEVPANLADFVNRMPAVIGSTTPNTSQGSISAGTAGLNALNLRSLGTNRTLVLLDGHRSAPSAASGQVDINTIPQALVSRVDIVTGGASADYGSDAVSGVVNFILDKKYTGLKGGLEYGETTYGEQPSYRGTLTYGTDFNSGKGHVLLSGEVFTSEWIPGNNRAWNKSGFFRIQNPAYNATPGPTYNTSVPFFLVGPNFYPSLTTPGGIVTAGPLRGTYFGGASATGTLSVGNLSYGTVSGPWMIGGEGNVTSDNYFSTLSLASSELRQTAFGRASYEIAPGIEVYAQASYTKWYGKSLYMAGWANQGGVTIQRDNAFLPPSVAASLPAPLTSLTIGTTNKGLPPPGTNNNRAAQRYLLGIQGTSTVFGRDYTWDLFGQSGITEAHEQTMGNWSTSRLTMAQDSVKVTSANVGTSGLAVGSIVCRTTLASPSNGCVPLSRIGTYGGLQDTLMGSGSYQKGIAYIAGAEQPYRDETLTEDVFGFNVSGSPLDGWAGPISIAFGAEWRKEATNGIVPAAYRSGWLYGNYLVNFGHYSVGEGFIEAAMPVMEGMDINGAIRYAAYSTSGGVNTWKLGMNYAPIDDVKFRVTYSHDIRAPNLIELYAAGIARANSVNINNNPYDFQQNQTGNPNLMPEAANSLGAGIVLTPTFIPGLTASVDYYNVTMKHQIGTITAQQIADYCYQSGVQSYCNNIHTTGSMANGTFRISTIDLTPFNFATQKLQGIDFDVTYQVPLESITLLGEIPGSMSLHGLTTHYIQNFVNDGLNPTTDTAGVNFGSGSPSWVYRVEAVYTLDPWDFRLVGRGFSAGKYANEFIECLTNCPVSTVANRTINNNNIDGVFYVDATVTYAFTTFGADMEAFFNVKNLFNTAPPPVGNGPDGINTPAYPQANGTLYDLIGRTFRTGVRFKL